MYCNMKVLIWNVVRGYEFSSILYKWDVLQRANMIRDGTETGLPSSTWIIEDIDQALEALKIVYRAHSAAVEGLADWTEYILAQWSDYNVSLNPSRMKSFFHMRNTHAISQWDKKSDVC